MMLWRETREVTGHWPRGAVRVSGAAACAGRRTPIIMISPRLLAKKRFPPIALPQFRGSLNRVIKGETRIAASIAVDALALRFLDVCVGALSRVTGQNLGRFNGRNVGCGGCIFHWSPSVRKTINQCALLLRAN